MAKRLEKDSSGTEDGGQTGTSASNDVGSSAVGELRRRSGRGGGRAGAGDDGDAGVRTRSAGAERDNGSRAGAVES
jgi:hypothetical protein